MTEGINPHCNAIDWMPFSIFSSSITFTLVNQISFIAGGGPGGEGGGAAVVSLFNTQTTRHAFIFQGFLLLFPLRAAAVRDFEMTFICVACRVAK